MKKELNYKIIKLLLNEQTFISMQDISRRLNVSKKTIQNYLSSSEFSRNLEKCGIERKQNLGVRLYGERKDLMKLERRILYKQNERNDESVLMDDTLAYILNTLFTSKEPVTSQFLGDKQFKSKSAIRKDLARAQKYLDLFNVKLIMKENSGNWISGEEQAILRAYRQFVLQELKNKMKVDNESILKANKVSMKYLSLMFPCIELSMVKESIKYSEEILNNKYTDNDNFILFVKILTLINRCLIDYHVKKSKEALKNTKEYFAAQVLKMNLETNLPIRFSEEETYEISEYILACRKQSNDELTDEVLDEKIAEHFLARVGDFLGITFEDDKSLLKNLMLHLKPAMRRLRYGVTSENPILKQIRYEFSDVYLAVLTSIEELEQERNISFDINEIGYICLHIVAAMNRKEKGSYIKTCLICDGGITMTNYLESAIKARVEELAIETVISSNHMDSKIYDHFDLILDASVETDKKHVNVLNIEPFLEQADITKINHWILSKQLQVSHKNPGSSVFKDTVFLFEDHLTSQVEVLKKYGDYLLRNGFVSIGFIESLIRRERKASTLIGRGVAVPHGSREFVNKSSIVIIKLSEKILWGEEYVNMVFLLAMNFEYEEESKKVFRRLYQIIADEYELKKLKQTNELRDIKEMFIEDTVMEEHMVKMNSIFQKENINMKMDVLSKKEAFEKMAEMLYQSDCISDCNIFVDAVMQREEEFSTGIGFGIAIPHARDEVVKKTSIAVAKIITPIAYASFDDEPITMLFMIAVPSEGGDDHMKILSMLSRKFMHHEFREKLFEASDENALLTILKSI